MKKRRAPSKRKPPLFSHPRHSGRRLPHHHTGYLPLLFFVAFAGLMLGGISATARASGDIVVIGRIPAPLPPSAAVISAPAGGEIYTAIPIDVQGTCPAGYLVKLTRNNFYSGSAICGAAGTFSIQTDLFAGSNDLAAHVYNITDDEGPQSSVVTVTYNPPIPPPAPAGQTEPGTPETSSPADNTSGVPPFILKADSSFKGYIVGQDIEWQLEVSGGTVPYAFNIDWGDGKSSVISRKEAGMFTVSHSYSAPGGYKGSYVIKITGSDGNDQKLFIQLLVIVNLPFNAKTNTLTTGSGKPGFSLRDLDLRTIIWMTYISVLVMIISFWFGGQWQFRHALLRNKKIRHTPRRA